MSKTKMPDLSNATAGFCVDELGRIKKEKSKLEKLEAYFKEGLKARLDPGQDFVEGEKYEATITMTTSARINADLVRELHPEIVEEVTKVSEYQTIRVKLSD